jgi:hypothetical protein
MDTGACGAGISIGISSRITCGAVKLNIVIIFKQGK